MRIGRYKIKRNDIDSFIVTKDNSKGIISKIIIDGGDFETLLNCLFIKVKINKWFEKDIK